MVLCQTDDRVLYPPNNDPFLTNHHQHPGPAFSTTSSSRPKSQHSATEYSDSAGTATSSCLVMPGLLFKRKSKQFRKASSAASTDQSSTAEHIFNPRAHNDRQQLLVRNSNQLTADWFDEEFLTSETSSQNQQPAVVTPTHNENAGASSSQTSTSLLAFPTPKDRSHHARRNLKQQQGMMHAYDGELEPEGVRGQEARVVAPPASSADIPIRRFTEAPRPLLPVRPLEEDEDEMEPYGSTRGVPAVSEQAAISEQASSTTSSQDLQSLIQTEFSGSRNTSNERMREPVLEDYPAFSQYPSSSQQHPPAPAQFQPSLPPSARVAAPSTNARRAPPSAAMPQRMDDSMMSHDDSHPPEFKVPRQSAPVNVDDSSFEDPGSNVQGIHAMAMEHVMRGEYDMALQAFSQVLSVYLEKYGRAHPLTASAYHNLGTVHSKRAGLLLDHTLHQRHCREQALLCFQAAARSARDSPQLGPSHPNVAVSLVRIGFLLLQSRQYQNAVVTFQEALRIRLDHYGPTHALVANLYNNMGVCHMHLQEFVMGRRYLQQALDIQKDLLGQDEFSTTALLELADTLCNIGGLCLEWIRQQGPDARHALDAESAFLEALEVRAKVLGENHPLTNQVRSLHDMVRSIPLPKMTDKANRSSYSAISPARSARISPSTTTWSKSPSSPGRPYATASTLSPIRPSHNTSMSQSSGGTPEALDMPTLYGDKQQQQQQQPRQGVSSMNRDFRPRQDPPALEFHPDLRPSPPGEFEPRDDPLNTTDDTSRRIMPTHRSAQSELASTFSSMISDAELNAYEATEESCLLDDPQNQKEDGQVTVVSYAQSTTSWSSTTKKETERLAYLMQAKAILDAHRDYMDSPQVALEKKKQRGATESTTSSQASPPKQQQPPESLEDGLAPLGGIWPEVTLDRITPEVLQNPKRHLKTIHASACNFFKRGRYSEALHLLEIVVEEQRSKNGPVHEDVGAALHNVGIAELRLGENYKALQAFEEAVRVRKGALGRDHPQVAVSLVKVGITLMLLKRLEDSLWIFREALTVRKHALGPLHPSTARIYNNIGCVHVEFGESKEAKRAFEAALDIQRNALVNEPDSGPILFGAATTLQNLAYLYRKNRMFEKEAVVLRESLGIQGKVLGTLHPAVMVTLESLALACSLSDHDDHALKYYNECLERYYEHDEDTREQQASIMFKMSRIHGTLDDRESQMEKLHLAVKILQADRLSPEGQDLLKRIELEREQVRKELDNSAPDWV